MQYNFVTDTKPKRAVVITPTMGSNKLLDAMNSVQQQTYEHVDHLVVMDGPEASKRFHELLDYAVMHEALLLPQKDNNLITMALPFNTGHGAQGFYGHRIYAGLSQLVDHDYVFFLDEDNWYQPNHVETLIETIENGNLDFAHSLRSIHSPTLEFLIDDNCESLGKWPIYLSAEKTKEKQYLIDTSSFAFRRQFLINVSQLWHSGWGGDRRFYGMIRGHAKHDTSGVRSLCYRLDGNPGSVGVDFFKTGNEYYHNYYKGDLPWIKRKI